MATTATGGADLSALDVIVDSDGHVEETFEEVVEHIDDRYAGAKRIIERIDHPKGELFTDIKPLPSPDSDEMSEGTKRLNAQRYTPEEKLEEMDRFNLDYSLLSPGVSTAVNTINNSECAAAIANGYNNWLTSGFLDASDRFKGGVLVAPQKPHRAAEDIDDRADESGVVAVQLIASGLIPPPGHEWYEPIYKAAEDNDLAVMMHTAGAKNARTFPMQYWWNETYAEDHTITHPFSHMWNLTSIILNGIPERYPGLDFVIQEAGLGWVPYLKYRLDEHSMMYSDQVPGLERLPSEMIDEQFFFTTQPLPKPVDNHRYVATMIEMIGPENVLYSGDFPHHDFNPPDHLFTYLKPYFDEDVVDDIMGRLAYELFW